MSTAITAVRKRCRPVGWRVAPEMMADRAYRHQIGLHEISGHYDLADAFVAQHGDTVLHGPFAGLHYPARRLASLPKRLGLYEWQLHGWIEDALRTSPRRFVDIGASDGYYAVGMAMRGLAVTAFEVSGAARADIRELASRNGVSLDVCGAANGRRVRELTLDHALVLSDCEGAEVDIFDAATVRALANATVIVEIHADVRPGAEQTLIERFDASHNWERVAPGEALAPDVPELSAVTPATRRVATDEMRTGHTPWVLLRPRG